MPINPAQALLDHLDPQTIIGCSLAGLLLGGIILVVFLYRRLLWYLRRLTKTTRKPPGIITGLRNLLSILLLIAVSGMLFFLGLFFQAYHRFNFEKPVAEIVTRPMGSIAVKSAPVTQVRFHPLQNGRDRYFFVNGDQWMIEGDILKWRPWLTLLGLDTRYRLTRITGRYLDINAERSLPRSILSLRDTSPTETEYHPLWRWLYRSGHKLPLVDTVYGNAAYQDLTESSHYLVFVGSSGFIVRKKEKGEGIGVKNKS